MNLPPVANAPGSQRKLFSRLLCGNKVCVCQHMPKRKLGSNRTTRDDALIPWYCSSVCVCVYRCVFHMLIHLLLQWFICKLGNTLINLLLFNIWSQFSSIVYIHYPHPVGHDTKVGHRCDLHASWRRKKIYNSSILFKCFLLLQHEAIMKLS